MSAATRAYCVFCQRSPRQPGTHQETRGRLCGAGAHRARAFIERPGRLVLRGVLRRVAAVTLGAEHATSARLSPVDDT
jgi:hypothetical protein